MLKLESAEDPHGIDGALSAGAGKLAGARCASKNSQADCNSEELTVPLVKIIASKEWNERTKARSTSPKSILEHWTSRHCRAARDLIGYPRRDMVRAPHKAWHSHIMYLHLLYSNKLSRFATSSGYELGVSIRYYHSMLRRNPCSDFPRRSATL